jgi:hypothetical protein
VAKGIIEYWQCVSDKLGGLAHGGANCLASLGRGCGNTRARLNCDSFGDE